MKIAVCDDDKQELLQIEQYVKEYLNECPKDYTAALFLFNSSADILAQIENGRHFDLFLLDVIMPGMNGIELAARIRETDALTRIIFLTSSPEFAVESYSVGAFHYILKPIQKNRLFPVLEKACSDHFSTPQQSILVKSQGTIIKIPLQDLVYVEVVGRTLNFKKKDGSLTQCLGTLSETETLLLADKRFIKPHRSYIVNMDYIKDLSQHGITAGSLCIPVSRNTFKEIKQSYLDYFFPKA